MEADQVESWLRRKVLSSACGRLLLAVGALAGGAVVLFITYWICYGVILFGFNWAIPHSHSIRCWISLAFVILLFVGNARTSREYLTEYSFSTGTASDKPVSFYVPSVGMVSNINPLAPDSMHSYVKIITDTLYTGPRMLVWSTKSFRKAYYLATLDVKECAMVIALLFEAGQKVSFVDIAAKLPSLNFNKVFTDLRYVNGILFLSEEPAGLTLDSTIKEEVQGAS